MVTLGDMQSVPPDLTPPPELDARSVHRGWSRYYSHHTRLNAESLGGEPWLESTGIWLGMQSQDIDVDGPSRSVLYSMPYGVHRSGLAVRPWHMHIRSAV